MKTTTTDRQKRVLSLICLSAILVMAACEQKGPAENAGKKIDQATAEAGKELESVKLSVDRKADTATNYIDDSMITAKVKEAFIADDLLKAAQIEVTTVNGVVKLSGSLDSEQLIARAVVAATSQKEVKSVQNELLLAAPSAAGK